MLTIINDLQQQEVNWILKIGECQKCEFKKMIVLV